MSAITLPSLLLRHLLTNPRRPTAAAAVTAIQAAHRGRQARRALRDVRSVCHTLCHALGEPPQVALGSHDFGCCGLGVVGPGQRMDAYSRDEECYIDVRGLLDLHRASLTSAACAIQSYVRRWFVLRSLLPAATLRRWCTLHPLPGWPHDPARPLSPSNLYLHPVEGGMSWAYCDRFTKFPVADALSPSTRPYPARLAKRAASHSQRQRQEAALARDMQAWHAERRLAHAVGLEQLRGADGVLRLYRPLHTHYDRRGDRNEYMQDHERRRWDAALAAKLPDGRLTREQALAAWLAERLDEGGFDSAWRAWEAGGGLCHHTPCLCGSCPRVTAALAPHAAAAAVPDDDIGSESVDVLGLGCPSDDDDLSDDDSDDAR